MNLTYGIMNSFVALWVLMYLGVEGVNAGCLSYGHSCWGGHGKRSGPKVADLPTDVGWTLGLKAVPDGGKSVVYGIPGKRPRGPRGRGIFPLTRAAIMESDGQDDVYGDGEVDSLKSSEVDDLVDENGTLKQLVTGGGDSNSIRIRQQRRRKAAADVLLDSMSGGGSSVIGSPDDESDFGRLLLSGAAGV